VATYSVFLGFLAYFFGSNPEIDRASGSIVDATFAPLNFDARRVVPGTQRNQMPAIRFVLRVSVLTGALLGATTGRAEPAHKTDVVRAAEPNESLGEPETVAKERARLLFEKGANAYRDGRFYDAVDIFLEINRLYPDPKLSFNVGKAFEGLGNQPGALRYYREYLRRLPDAPDKREVEQHVEQIELALSQRGIQQITVLSSPDGATVLLDGQAVGVTPWTGESFAGKHRIQIAAAQFQPIEAVIEIDLHRARDFQFELRAMPKPAPVVARAPQRSEPKITALTLGTFGTGLALLGTALIAQAASGSDAHGATRTAAFFAGSGAGVSLLGGVMLYFDLNPSSGAKSGVTGISFDGPGLEHSR